jgi:hypothetical protein
MVLSLASTATTICLAATHAAYARAPPKLPKSGSGVTAWPLRDWEKAGAWEALHQRLFE